MEINRQGCTRIVILTKRYAFKIPNIEEYRLFLQGLLANMQEVVFSSAKYEGFCPVIFYLQFGLLIVMPRVKVLTDEEFQKFDYETFRERYDYEIPSERKASSFGWLNDEIVAIDYGN
jgi:hypothetical protein